MSQLTALQNGLNSVRRFRSMVRLGSALSVMISVVLWMLLIAFALDVLTHMGKIERFIVVVVFVGTSVWTFRKYVAPAFAVHETQNYLALMVERQQGISSDLVAALQFADTKRDQFGSSDLRGAVVDYTAEVAPKLDYLEGFSADQLKKRLAIAVVTIMVALIPCVAFGQHTAVFFNRFLLGSDHYPTKTQIEQISPKVDGGWPTGRDLLFKVKVSGEHPADREGYVDVKALASGVRLTIALKPSKEDANIYVGSLKRPMEDMSYAIYIGDAYTDPRILKLIALPMVDVRPKITTPAYASKKFKSDDDISRQWVALEGSRVEPIVTTREKKLESAVLTVNEKDFPMIKDEQYGKENKGDRFYLDDEALEAVGLAQVKNNVRFTVQVKDTDGLSLERPRAALVQVRPDRRPRINVQTVTRFVLVKVGRPTIRVEAKDDYALDRILVHKMVEKANIGSDEQQTRSKPITVVIAKSKNLDDKISRIVKLRLDDLDLAVGDRVVITFEAIDYRGESPGRSSRSESLVFQVTDRAGLITGLRELDLQMDKKLDEIIRTQSESGDKP